MDIIHYLTEYYDWNEMNIITLNLEEEIHLITHH